MHAIFLAYQTPGPDVQGGNCQHPQEGLASLTSWLPGGIICSSRLEPAGRLSWDGPSENSRRNADEEKVGPLPTSGEL